MSSAKSDDVFRFACDCGVALSARPSQVGRKGQCGKCRRIVVVPKPGLQPAAGPSAAEAPMREVCSVCQCPIDADEQRTACNRCGLPFHEECWRENLGCSAYGCGNVNALKTGPDIRIAQTQAAAVPQHALPRRPAASSPQPVDWPLDHIILGASAVAALLSVVMCGMPSMLVGLAAFTRLMARRRQDSIALSLSSLALAMLGVLLGGCLSLMFWMS